MKCYLFSEIIYNRFGGLLVHTGAKLTVYLGFLIVLIKLKLKVFIARFMFAVPAAGGRALLRHRRAREVRAAGART